MMRERCRKCGRDMPTDQGLCKRCSKHVDKLMARLEVALRSPKAKPISPRDAETIVEARDA